ncbi:MAG: MFS transporter [Planctomycetaceae bacterium]|nr:MFS transporter [Planctomycetaceae bacterium]
MSDSVEQETVTEEPDHSRHETRNTTILALQLVVMRIGWIFKTESVIIPHVLDIISSNASWARGFLPVLNRLGQSIPPLMASNAVRDVPLKKRALLLTTLGMALPFLLLAAVWWWLESPSQMWFVVFFLVLYLIFFSATGLNQMVTGTLHGKLIPAERRGRLLGIAGFVGSIGAVAAGYYLLRPWIQLPKNVGFIYIFAFNGSAYFLAGLLANLCVEEPDEAPQRPRVPWWSPFVRAWEIFRHDARFRSAAVMSTLFMTGLLLFPHYQALAKEFLGSEPIDLIWWVIAQNISVGILSPLLGKLADNYGNRLALRWSAFVAAITPLIAVMLASEVLPNGRQWFWVTYVFLGITPVTMRTIANYTLELVPREEHPQYLSTMTICYTVPFLLSPLFGILLDYVPFQIPFIAVSGLILLGGVMTFWMAEPRHSK